MTGEKQFGTALYELAVEENKQEDFLQGITAVLHAFEQAPEYLKLLSNPAIPKAERLELVEKAFGENCERHVVSFVKILCERGELAALKACEREYRALLYAARGILPVTAAAAIELSNEQKSRLREKLCAATGKTVELSCVVDTSLIAGVRLSYEGKQLDGTVKQRLDTIKAALLS